MSGMKKLRPRACSELNSSLGRRLMSFFKVMRENHPVSINFHFGRAAGELEQRPAGEEQDFGNHVSTERLNQVFDGRL